MKEDTKANQQPIDDPVYRVDNSFYVKAYQKWEHFEEPYISILWNGEYYRVYNKLLYEFLSSKSVELLYPFGKFINGSDYLESYVEGHHEGTADFDKYFPLSAFHGANADAFVNSLHRKCLHQFNEVFEGNGWIEAARSIPYLINHSAIKYYGFFNAKLTKYDQLVDNYSELFEKLISSEYAESKAEHKTKLNVKSIRQPLRVVIAPKAKDRVHEALKDIVLDSSEYVALSGLIMDNILPSKPMKANANQTALAHLFKTLSDKNLMPGTQVDIAKWICASFSDTTFEYIHEAIRKGTVPSKKSRIPIKLDDL